MTKTELIEEVQRLQKFVGTKVSATSTLKSKSVAELEGLRDKLEAESNAAGRVPDNHREEMAEWTRSQCVQYLRDNGYDGPVSYLMPRLREIAMQWGE